tara:strand:- start:203 stop:418 length:216 start_codon:yes stop_codon:yes gene_type:complete
MTKVEYATPENFQAWREEAKTMTAAALMHTIQDCRTAEKAMRGWNPVKEGFYSDQAATYGMELRKRNMNKK